MQFKKLFYFTIEIQQQWITTLISSLYWARWNQYFPFPLDIDVNDILNYRTNYLLRICRKKAIANKWDCLSTHLLIVTFHEIVIKYEPELKTQLVLLDISTNYNMGSPRSLPFKFCQMICLFNTFILLWRIFIYAVGYLVTDLGQISYISQT